MAVFSVTTVRGDAPFRFETTPGQLPKAVRPIRYAIRIEPDIENASFQGEETIQIDVKSQAQALVLNSSGLEITKAELLGSASTPLTPKLNKAHQTLTLTPPGPLPSGKYSVRLIFRGKLSEQPGGLYLARYQVGGKQKLALATHMEATYARQMFPCWDEPAFRAAFQLTAVVPSKHVVVSNTPIERERPLDSGRKEVSFAETPTMASYLVAFVSGELEELCDEVKGVRLRVLTTPGKREQARYALEATKKILPFYNDYFGTPYPLKKLDQIALPNTSAGAMENWGAIIYNDNTMLFDPSSSSHATKERVFSVLAHEIAHQWFGNLVTMAWWDNLWLNEGFASWLGTKATERFNPEWRIWVRAAESRECAMKLDALSTTHPIQQPVTDESQTDDAFDQITYSKGQAFLRMLEAWLGEETFRGGIRRYIQEHAYSNTTTADLWNALEKSTSKPVRAMASGWTEQPGFPVIDARETSDGKIVLSQSRFTIHQQNPASLCWKVPVALGCIGQPEKREMLLLENEPQEAAGASWPLKVNFGSDGYFRTAYSPKLFGALQEVVMKLSEEDRLNLLNDTWALVQSGQRPVTQYLELVAALSDERSPSVIESFGGTLGFIHHLYRAKRWGAPTQHAGEAFDRWAIAVLRKPFNRLGWESRAGESELDGQLRGSLVATLGSLGDKEIQREAVAQFERFAKNPADPALLPGDLRSAVLGIAGRLGGESRFNQLHEMARKQDSFEQKRMLYKAMARTEDPQLIAKTLALALTDELIPAAAARLVQTVADDETQTDTAWRFAREHLPALLAKVSSSLGSNAYVPNIFRNFADASRAEELEKFAVKNLPAAVAPNVAKAADEIRFNAEFASRNLPEIDAWCEKQMP